MTRAAASPSRKSQKPLLLVVEDFTDAREMYQEYLSFSGYRVSAVSDGQAAVDQATRLSPDLILMDLSLPVLDGWEATRRLKCDPRTRHIPVLAITANAFKGSETTARQAGCDAFVAKPCHLDDLLVEIRRVLSRRRRRAR